MSAFLSRSGFRIGVVVAGVLLTAGAASAADMTMPLKAAREPVYRCDLKGFIELPGTDICLRIGGHARLVTTGLDKNWIGDNAYVVRNIAVDGFTVPQSGVLPAISQQVPSDGFQMYGQGRIHFDARSATDIGPVRAYVEGQADDNESRTGGAFGLRHAYVQIGEDQQTGWLFGKTWSTFLDRDAGPSYADPYKVVGDNSQSMRRNQIRYTRMLGGGFSLAVAVEDEDYNTPPAAIIGIGPNAPIINPAATSFAVVNGRNEVPDAVAYLRWEDKAIGSVQLSGAVHQNVYAEQQTIGGATLQSGTDYDVGYALLFGVKLNLPTGEGDKFTFLATWTDGASQYVQDTYGSNTDVVWGRCGTANCIFDDVTRWGLVSSITHKWAPAVATTLGAGYADTDYEALGTSFVGATATPGTLDVATYEIFGNVEWTPVPNLSFLLDVHYGHIDFGGMDVNPIDAGIQDAGGAWAASLQITRSF